MTTPVYIVSAKRTPNGSFQGQFSGHQGWQLGAEALKSAALPTHTPECVYLGCVLGAGQGQAPARQATCTAFSTTSIPAVTVNKICGSGIQSVVFGAQSIQSGDYSVVMVGGFESMTNAPYLLPSARGGQRMGHGVMVDHMFLDGLEDAYDIAPNGSRRAMGTFADATAARYGISRQEQEAFATETFENYQRAESAGLLSAERATITITDAKGNVTVINKDEPPSKVKPAKFEALRPAFSKTGTVTAATSSSIADGAAALTLSSEAGLKGVEPLAKIIGFATHAHEPEWFTTAPIDAIKKLLTKINWTVADVDLFEVNEAFAVVPMVVMKELGIERSKMNVHGGSCTVGHPIGASGTRIIVTLIHALKARNLKRGVAAVCIGGGEAVAVAIEV